MTDSVKKNIQEIMKIYSKSYWWADRYDYLSELPISELHELKKHLDKCDNLSEMWEKNRQYCQIIIQEHRHKQIKKVIK